ncbi:MAG: ABC transporter substrate-binding protein [Chloroflexota bacterium]|nr:ABC transporter substrate-binding protein [Chloroflexota bacterium]
MSASTIPDIRRRQVLRWLAAGVGATVASGLLTACGSSSSNTPGAQPAATTGAAQPTTAAAAPASGQKASLTFWNGFTGPDRPALEGLVDQFNKSHPNIAIEMTISPWDTLLQKLPTSLATGQGPDLIGFDFNLMPQYAKSGNLMDLSNLWQAGSDFDPSNFPQAVKDAAQWQGKFYGVPMNFSTLLMYINKDMFQAAGLDPAKPPQNWDEWMQAIKTLSKQSGATGDQYGLAIGEHDTIPNWPIFIWGNGGDIVKDNKSALADPKTIDALKTWGDLVKNDKISPVGLGGADVDKLFQSKKAAMEISGPWLTTGFTQAGINYDCVPVPAGPAGAVTCGDSVLMVVNKASKSPDAALEFLKFWGAKDSQITWSAQSGFPPARLDLADNAEIAKNPWVPKFAAVAKSARFYLPGQVKAAQINDEAFVPMIQQITQGQKSADESARAADQQVNGLLAQS